MIQEKELIGGLRKLRQIKPRKEWVSLTKSQILGEDKAAFSFFSFSYLKPAFAGFTAIFVILGLFGFSQNSLPGDPLYAIKRFIEKGQAFLVSDQEKPGFQLELANNRLEDLVKASGKNLAPTINEFNANISEAAKNLSNFDISTSTPAAIKKIAEETKKLEENKQKIESLGVVVGEEETSQLNSALFRIIKVLMRDLDNRVLNLEQTKVVDEMRGLFIEGKYSEALELYLINQ